MAARSLKLINQAQSKPSIDGDKVERHVLIFLTRIMDFFNPGVSKTHSHSRDPLHKGKFMIIKYIK